MKGHVFIVLIIAFGINHIFAQKISNQQKELEEKRLRLKNEIKQINALLFSNSKIRKNAIIEVEDIQVKLNVRSELIKITNQQANLLNRRITINERNILNQRKELDQLKDEYAKMIQKSYVSKSLKNRLMFLFSSESFLQAYKRIQYLKQYSRYRKKQGLAIGKKTQLLQRLNQTLIEEKGIKFKLIEENREIQDKLQKERELQKALIKTLKQKQSDLRKRIVKKQNQRKVIDIEIKRLIREAIAASNKALKNNKKNTFNLTPEAKLIATNFRANKIVSLVVRENTLLNL